MDPKLEKLFLEWPLPVIKDVDIATLLSDMVTNQPGRRYAIINRALKKGTLIRLRRGVYLIGTPFRKVQPSHFQVAHTLYGPGYISFESALFYHQWIPEAVYTTISATTKRAREFETPIGHFSYLHVPEHVCYLGTQRIEDKEGAFFVATPWKALADHYYVHNKNWNKPKDLYLDMRIEVEQMLESDLETLQMLSKQYQSNRVRKFLCKIWESLTT